MKKQIKDKHNLPLTFNFIELIKKTNLGKDNKNRYTLFPVKNIKQIFMYEKNLLNLLPECYEIF